MPTPLLSHHWATSPDSIRVTLINGHGDADAFTTEVATFPLTEAGIADAEFLLTALPHVADAVVRLRERCSEDVCRRLSEKLKLDYERLFKMLEPLLRCDARHDGCFAIPVGYVAERSEAGHVQHVLFDDGFGGKSTLHRLTNTHPSYLRQWDRC